MKILSSEQLYQADKLTTERQGIAYIDLMERAATEIFNWLLRRQEGELVPIYIFCGTGNNGGDGLALARLLIGDGFEVQCYIASFSDQRTDCFSINYQRYKESSKQSPVFITSAEGFTAIESDAIIVDCLFGIGLNRPPEGWVKALIQYLNQCKAYRVSVDIPSGLYPDRAIDDPEAIIRADQTLTFQTPKLSFFLPDSGPYIPNFEVLDIGLDSEYLASVNGIAETFAEADARALYVPRNKISHKGTYGHVLIVAGSYGSIGAAVLSTKAALRIGAGKVTSYIPECGYTTLQTAVPEAMVCTDANYKQLSNIEIDFTPEAIAVGMGIGTSAETAVALEALLRSTVCPVVIDADALNCIASGESLLASIPKNAILTPHPGELVGLISKWADDFDKIEKTQAFAERHQVIIVIKGAHSMIVSADQLIINTSGNPGMATAGSGDVLSGVIAGLLAQGYKPIDAAKLGVYLHGYAGDIAANNFGCEGLIAGDIVDLLSTAYGQFYC